MRWLLLLLLAGPVLAQDVEHLLERERFEEARRIVEKRLLDDPQNRVLKEQWAVALRGQARDLQRVDGYGAAIALLEENLAHRLLAEVYGETCLWAGREEEGVLVLRRCGLPLADRIVPELQLLGHLRRYDELVARAVEASRTVPRDEVAKCLAWEQYGREESAMRKRLLSGATRGRNAAVIALLSILLAAAVIHRLAPPVIP